MPSVNAFGDEDDFDEPADQCGTVGDIRDVRSPICVLKPGHSGPHRQMVIGTEEIGVEPEVSRLTRELKTAYTALEAYQAMTMEQRVAAIARLVEKKLLSLEQALGLSELVRERNTFLQRLLLLKAEAKAVVEISSDDPDIARILQGRIRVRELLQPGPEDSVKLDLPEEIPVRRIEPLSAADEIAKAKEAVIEAVLAENEAWGELAAANGMGTQTSTACGHISKAKLARLTSVGTLKELLGGHRYR